MKKPAVSAEINGLIFKEVVKRGYSLEGKTRVWDVADSKLWYLRPDQAQAYLDVLDSVAYKKGLAPREGELISENIDFIVQRVGNAPVNLVDLGCGDGRKAIAFIEALSKVTKVRYCPIDISAYMVQKAIDNISKLNKGEVVTSQWNISDFDNLTNVTSLINDKEYSKSLFLLLGNTLGNFEFHDLLYQIRSSMKSGDYLVIGNGIESDKTEEAMMKFNEENKYHNEFMIKILLQLGFKPKEVESKARFRNHRVEFYYDILVDHTVAFGGKEVHFQKGDQIIVAVVYHYSRDDFRSFLNLYFDEVTVKFSKDNTYALAICKK